MDEHDLGLGIPADQTTEAAGGDVAVALFPLAKRRRERLVRNKLALGEEVRVARKLDCHIEEPDRSSIFMASSISTELAAVADQRRLKFAFKVHSPSFSAS